SIGALGAAIDLTGALSSRFAEIEKVDLEDGSPNAVILDAQAVIDTTGSNGDAFPDDALLIKGDVGDSLTLVEGWILGPEVVDPFGETGSYTPYSKGAVSVLVDNDVAVVGPFAPGFPVDTDAAANEVAENAAPGTTVGITALSIDPDAGDSVTYSLVD